VVVDEMRKARLDLLARAKFAADGEQITETRLVLDDDADEEQQVTQFLDMAGDGLIEVS
jgi:Holliday junction resolvase RusA-like endonuclease